MTWLPILVSLAALVVSIASFRRSDASIRREKVLRLEQRKQAASVSALTSELGLTRCLEAMILAKSSHPDLEVRLENICNALRKQISDLQTQKKKIDQLDPFRLTTDDAEVQLEALIGQLAGLHERIKLTESQVAALAKELGAET